MKQTTRERVAGGIERLSGATLDLRSLIDEAGRLIERAIPNDGACWHTMDPATLIETSFHTHRMPSHGGRAAEFEYVHEDYNKYVQLARSQRHSGVLSEATGGVLDRSPRYRNLMKAAGMRGELRAALVVDHLCWGSVAFFRQEPDDFDADERDLAHELTRWLGRAFRASLITEPGTRELGDRSPGMILFNRQGQVDSSTANAQLWIDELPGEDHAGDGLPHALLSVVARARATSTDAVARVPGRSGHWVTLHASAASGQPGRVAVILQGASPTSIAPLIAAAHGFTDRERELAELVLQGFGTAEIAARLYISPLTVQGHLKSIFAKAGVRSRRELVGKVFVRHYKPRMASPLGGNE